MTKGLTFICCLLLLASLMRCDSGKSDKTATTNAQNQSTDTINLLTDIKPLSENGDVNAVIEIPAGTTDKWELDKSTGQLQWEMVDNAPRIVNYLGYPGNYGMIPMTLLSKENGGDGDPLDILVLGPPIDRGLIQKCKIIGVLYLKDRGEQDDKLIAVSNDSPLYIVNSIDELNNDFKGISEIIETWFTNYKGPENIESMGFDNKQAATDILMQAIQSYQQSVLSK
ncbi:inorganic diphosphatase [Psychroserpens algicola]|uniref:inorganic diphosphatase n=1 Tax=Psychroserpens algicola TaxID=1719034 RepID=A0ABT0H5E9_9FLAO|nr:inorganic diphosphatase [Psychroserpens algicola]MCK8479586.1 inorganic diphosphatase [Psychroserpens algicola]